MRFRIIDSGGIAAGLIALLFSTASHASLISADGGLAYYDTVLNATWLADANLAASNKFGVVGVSSDGAMSWSTANSYIAAMNAADYLGVNTWQLPTVTPLNGTSFNYSVAYDGSTDIGFGIGSPASTANELRYMYYVNLGNTQGYTGPPVVQNSCVTTGPSYCLTSMGPFSHIISGPTGIGNFGNYWEGLEYAPASGNAWSFEMYIGSQSARSETEAEFVWAVASGDVFGVEAVNNTPLPAALPLFASGLSALGLLGWRRKRKNAAAIAA